MINEINEKITDKKYRLKSAPLYHIYSWVFFSSEFLQIQTLWCCYFSFPPKESLHITELLLPSKVQNISQNFCSFIIIITAALVEDLLGKWKFFFRCWIKFLSHPFPVLCSKQEVFRYSPSQLPSSHVWEHKLFFFCPVHPPIPT